MLPDNRGKGRSTGLAGLLGRIAAALVAVAVLVLAVMFSVALFAIALIVGTVVFAWLWWKMRRALRQAQQDPRFDDLRRQAGAGTESGAASKHGSVIEGEVIRGEWQDDQNRQDRPD